VVDTSSGWICAGAISDKTMKDVARELATNPEKASNLCNVAGSLVVDAGKITPEADTPEAQNCLSAAIGAITQTQSYKLATQKDPNDGLNGHWLYVTYKLKDESLLSRPIFFRKPDIANGFAPMDVIIPLLQHVVDQDTKNALGSTSIFRQITAGGGAQLAAEFGGPPVVRPPSER
jgi:hypothetical protein